MKEHGEKAMDQDVKNNINMNTTFLATKCFLWTPADMKPVQEENISPTFHHSAYKQSSVWQHVSALLIKDEKWIIIIPRTDVLLISERW